MNKQSGAIALVIVLIILLVLLVVFSTVVFDVDDWTGPIVAGVGILLFWGFAFVEIMNRLPPKRPAS